MPLTFESFTLAAATTDLETWKAAGGLADCLEFRMDLATDPMDQLNAYDGELPLICTNRAPWEGGEGHEDDSKRLDVLAKALEYDAVAAIDVEFESISTGDASDVKDAAEAHDIPVIASMHDFERTPSPSVLRRRLRRASHRGTVAKLATTATNRMSVLDMLTVTHELSREGISVATMVMGEAGRHSRAIAPLYGSKIGYAPIDPAEATAPGQYTLEELSKLLDSLGLERGVSEA